MGTEYYKINYRTFINVHYPLLHSYHRCALDTQAAIALRREVTVPDFMKPDVETIDIPTSVSLEAHPPIQREQNWLYVSTLDP